MNQQTQQPGLRVLVCGGRNYHDYHRAADVLDEIHAKTPIACIIHGNAKGGDRLGQMWAENTDVPQDIHDPNWDIPHLTEPAPITYSGIIDSKGNKLRDNWQQLITEPTTPKINKKTGKWYNVRAGFNRNGLMLKNGKPDLVVALPGGNGTADMANIARKADITVIIVKPK